jgi:hypothetical protein
MITVFPGVRVDTKARTVEFDAAISPMLVRDPKAPAFFLEVLACSFNTREHETFVVSRVKPSHIHAALLAVGLKPGTPGSWTSKDGRIVGTAPTGDRIAVRFVYENDAKQTVEADPLTWIVSSADRSPFLDRQRQDAAKSGGPAPGFVFAGSRFVTRAGASVYDADGAGIIIGLTTFGSELIGYSRMLNPDASVEAPSWIADLTKTPPPDTAVRVRLRPE